MIGWQAGLAYLLHYDIRADSHVDPLELLKTCLHSFLASQLDLIGIFRLLPSSVRMYRVVASKDSMQGMSKGLGFEQSLRRCGKEVLAASFARFRLWS